MNDDIPQKKNSLIPTDAISRCLAATKRAASLVSLTIASNDQMDEANKLIIALKEEIAELVTMRQAAVAIPKNKVQTIEDFFRTPIKALENAAGVIGKEIGRYYGEIERQRQEKERAEQEAQRTMREEAERKSEQHAVNATALFMGGNDAAAAKELEASQTQLDFAQSSVPPFVPPASVAGASMIPTYEVEIEDSTAAIVHMMGNDVLRAYVIIDSDGLKKLQCDRKGAVTIPGIRFSKTFSHRRNGGRGRK
jgi:hypothetical protein